MKTSVVVTTYNGQNYITELLYSLKNQTQKIDEVLIYDDRSNDQTADIVNRYIKDHGLSNWKFYINKKNKGWKRNFIEGLWNASGDIVFPCDQDDIWMPNKVEVMSIMMKEHPEINVLTSNYESVFDDGTTKNQPEPENGMLIKQTLVKDIFTTKYPGCTYAIRHDYIEISKQYWQSDFPHDALFWRMAMFSGTLYSLNTSLIKWRKHKDSAYSIESVKSKTKEAKRIWLDYALRVIASLQEFTKNEQVNNVAANEILEGSNEWINLRIKFYDTRKISYGLKLLHYKKFYTRFRQLIGDWYLVYK